MKRWILIGMVVASGMTMQAQNKLPEKFPYQDTSLTAEERADDLLKRLTLEEKASLMMNGSPAIPRLSIKAYGWWNEALHGPARRTGLLWGSASHPAGVGAPNTGTATKGSAQILW